MNRFTFDPNCNNTYNYNYDPTYAYGGRILQYSADYKCYRVDYVRVFTNKNLLQQYPYAVQHRIKYMYEKEQKVNLNYIIKRMQHYLLAAEVNVPWKQMGAEVKDGNITVYHDNQVFCVFEGFYCMLKPGQSELSRYCLFAIQKSIDNEFKKPKVGGSFTPQIPYNMTYMYGYERPLGWVNAFVADTPGRICTTNEMHSKLLRRAQCMPTDTLCRDIPKERIFQYADGNIMVCNDIIDLYDQAMRGGSELDLKVRTRYVEHHLECVKLYIKQYNTENKNANLRIKSGTQTKLNQITQQNEIVTKLEDQQGFLNKTKTDHQWELYGFYAIPVQTPKLEVVRHTIASDVYKIKGMAYELLLLLTDQISINSAFEEDTVSSKLITLIESEKAIRKGQTFVTPTNNEFVNVSAGGARIVTLNNNISFVYHGNNEPKKPVFITASVKVINNGESTYHVLEYPEFPYPTKAVSLDDYKAPPQEEVKTFLLKKFDKIK